MSVPCALYSTRRRRRGNNAFGPARRLRRRSARSGSLGGGQSRRQIAQRRKGSPTWGWLRAGREKRSRGPGLLRERTGQRYREACHTATPGRSCRTAEPPRRRHGRGDSLQGVSRAPRARCCRRRQHAPSPASRPPRHGRRTVRVKAPSSPRCSGSAAAARVLGGARALGVTLARVRPFAIRAWATPSTSKVRASARASPCAACCHRRVRRGRMAATPSRCTRRALTSATVAALERRRRRATPRTSRARARSQLAEPLRL